MNRTSIGAAFRPALKTSATVRRFRGGGQQLRITAMPGTQLSQYSATFREPYLMDSRVSFSLSGQYFMRYYQDWTEVRAGGRAGLGYQFTPDLSGTFALRGEAVNVKNPTVPTPPELEEVLGIHPLYHGPLGPDARYSRQHVPAHRRALRRPVVRARFRPL